MIVSVEVAPRALAEPTLDPVFTAWHALHEYLERRSKALCDEVRNYPTPIARCDVQLTKLIEQRTRAIETLGLAQAADPARDGHADRRWLAALDALLRSAPGEAEDNAEASLRAALQAAIAGMNGRA